MAETETTETNEGKSEEKIESVENKDNTVEVLKEIRDKLSEDKKETPPSLTREQIRARVKETTGFTDAQLDFHENMTRSAIVAATAPLQEKVAWAELKEEVGKIEPEVKKLMDEELAQYPKERRGDPVLLKKVYKMSVGDLAIRNRNSSQTKETTQEPEKEESTVVQRRIVSTPSSQGLSSGGPKTVRLSDEEKIQARRFKMSEEEYAKYKGSNDIQSFRSK